MRSSSVSWLKSPVRVKVESPVDPSDQVLEYRFSNCAILAVIC